MSACVWYALECDGFASQRSVGRCASDLATDGWTPQGIGVNFFVFYGLKTWPKTWPLQGCGNTIADVSLGDVGYQQISNKSEVGRCHTADAVGLGALVEVIFGPLLGRL